LAHDFLNMISYVSIKILDQKCEEVSTSITYVEG
jgi:hypothetical protein